MVKIFISKNLKKFLCLACIALGLVLLYINYLPKSTIATVTDNQVNNCACQMKLKTYFIEVMGQVVNPGVYEIDEDKLVIEAIELAGGYTSNADLTFVHRNISLSSVVKPTQKIYIPAINEDYIPNSINLLGEQSGKINLNTGKLYPAIKLYNDLANKIQVYGDDIYYILKDHLDEDGTSYLYKQRF